MMRRRTQPWCVLFGAMLILCPHLADAQDGQGQPGGSDVGLIRGAAFDVRCDGRRESRRRAPIATVPVGSAGDGDCLREVSTLWFRRADRLTFPLSDSLEVHGTVQFDTTTSHAAFGQTWQARAGMTYRVPGGIEFSAGVVGRRGYEVPLFVTEGFGAESVPFVTNSPMLDTTRRPVLWDTVLRVEKQLFTSDLVRVSIVGEAYNLLNINRDQHARPLTETLTSRVGRLGLKFAF